jgi:hypothetical protein
MAAKRQVEILKELRALMKISNYVGQEPIHAYIIPSGDAHQVRGFFFDLALFITF